MASEVDTPVCWLDLETTGTDERVDEILEVGVVLTSPDWLEVYAEKSWVRCLSVERLKWHRDRVPEVVQLMHEQNGLWGACTDPLRSVPLDVIQWRLEELL